MNLNDYAFITTIYNYVYYIYIHVYGIYMEHAFGIFIRTPILGYHMVLRILITVSVDRTYAIVEVDKDPGLGLTVSVSSKIYPTSLLHNNQL